MENKKKKEKSESHLKSMTLIKGLAKSILENGQLKKKNLTVSRIDDSSNKEREVQDMDTKIYCTNRYKTI